MAAQTVVGLPAIKRFTLGTVDETDEITLPVRIAVLTVYCDQACKLALTGTQGGAIDADNFDIEADRYFELRMDAFARNSRTGTAPQTVYVTSSVGGAEFVVSAE